jgi:hypothetical protein
MRCRPALCINKRQKVSVNSFSKIEMNDEALAKLLAQYGARGLFGGDGVFFGV